MVNALNKITHYFKKCTTASGALKKIFCLYKNFMFQVEPLNSSCCRKLQYSEKTALFRKPPLQMYLLYLTSNCNCCCEIVKLTSKLTVSKLFRNSPLKVEMSTIALLKHLLYFINICNRCSEIFKLAHS